MRFRTLFLFAVLALTVLFALLNWPAFTTPTTLSLVFGTVQAPIGLVMLGVVFVLAAMCLTYLIWVQGSALMDTRRHTKEMQLQRDLADKAEASRFTELHNFVNAEMQKMERIQADTRDAALRPHRRDGKAHAAGGAGDRQLAVGLHRRAGAPHGASRAQRLRPDSPLSPVNSFPAV